MEKEKEEVWKEVPNYSNYMVSDKGRVKSLNFSRTGQERILKQNIVRYYLAIDLYKEGKRKTFYIHKLVAIAFLSHVPCGHNLVVDHMDGNKLNNNLDNLQVVTNRDNLSRKGGSSQYVGVSWSKQNKKWRAMIRVNSNIMHLGYFEDEVSASNAYKNKLKEILK